MMKKKVKIFDIVLIVIFTVFSLVMIIPVYKVLVDSFDLKTAYGMKLFPEQFGFAGYKSIFTNPTMLRPFRADSCQRCHENNRSPAGIFPDIDYVIRKSPPFLVSEEIDIIRDQV